jgi:cardiolipin synthase A/B
MKTARCLLIILLCLGSGCSSMRMASVGSDHPFGEYRETFGIVPAVFNGVPLHLLRSHTTAIAIRPVASTVQLGGRVVDWSGGIAKRVEIRFRYPALDAMEIPAVDPNREGMDMVAWERRLDTLTGEATYRAKVELIVGGEAFYGRLEEAIDGAQERIDWQTYIFDNDDVAQGLAERLRKRADDVDVRLIFDGLGTYLAQMVAPDSLPSEHQPIRNLSSFLAKDTNIKLRTLPNVWLAGSHVKNYMFDRRIAFVGGMNIGREYRYDWHDMMLRLEGEAVGRLLEIYEETWHLNGYAGEFARLFPREKHEAVYDDPGDVPLRFLHTRPADAQIYKAQLEAIRRSKKSISIENAYFSDDRIIYELCKARLRGVDVRVIMPAKVNHQLMERSNRIAINTLLRYGGRVFLYPKFSHVKAAVYDGWACLGTANFDKLSLQINRELNVGTSHPETVKHILETLFEADIRVSTEVTEPIPLDFEDHLWELIADEA